MSVSGFHTLRVTALERTTRDALAVTLEPPAGVDFSFTQGQYLTFRREFDGVELRRSYSLCAPPHGGELKVGIKRVAGGTFSTFINEELAVGDTLEAMAPMGRFWPEKVEVTGEHYLGFAAGSGITPLLSILRTVLETHETARFTLVYANVASNTIMFREPLDDLKNRFMDRFALVHMLENDAQDVELFTGRLTAQKCDALFAHWVKPQHVAKAFICGPQPMMETVADRLAHHGMAKDDIRFELFASGQPGRAARPAKSAQAAALAKPAELTVTLDGTTRTLTMDRDQTVLDAALENAVEAPYACKAGVCSTCRAKVTQGEFEMLTNHALEDYEIARGYVLTCQCLPLGDKLVVDYDG
ncbi:MAG: 2Fe-2S iron-sulfur cluster-binding protein [Pseudomonadota bacterium]